MTSLFDQNFHYCDRAHDLDRELRRFLRPIYEEFMEEGYSPREVTAMVIHAAVTAENRLIAEWTVTKATSQGNA